MTVVVDLVRSSHHFVDYRDDRMLSIAYGARLLSADAGVAQATDPQECTAWQLQPVSITMFFRDSESDSPSWVTVFIDKDSA